MRFLITIVIIFISSCPLMAHENSLCDGKSANLYCLKENFPELYSKNYGLFWNILHDATQKLKVHKNIPDIAAFMEISPIIKGNAEVAEFFSNICEEFCVSNPELCLEALTSLNDESKKSFLDRLRNPIYLSKIKIDNIFLKNKTIKKYHNIMSIYFQEQTEKKFVK